MTIGVEHPGCIIVSVILDLGRRCRFLSSACRNCGSKEGRHFRVGDKREVNDVRIRPFLFELEKETPVLSEAFEVWVAVLTIITEKLCNPEWLESLFIRCDRAHNYSRL